MSLNRTSAELAAPPARAPDHSLGQYNAWRAEDDSALDLAWTSIASGDNPAAHLLLPHGEPSVALYRRRDDGGAVIALDLVICGPYYKARPYRPDPNEELIAWRIKPELAAALYGVAPGDLGEVPRASAPTALKEKCSATLRLGESGGASEILISLKADLLRAAHKPQAMTRPEILAAQILRATNGQARLRDIARKLDVSERTLRRRFTDHVGCAPKTYARHLQIAAAALTAETSANPDWAEIAAGAGFHDQPHMINAFQAEVGMTPAAFHKERRRLL